MKKSILILSIGLMLSATVKAQQNKHEFRLTYGVGSSSKLADDISGALSSAILGAIGGSSNNYEYKSGNDLGVIGLSYRATIVERLKVGGDVGYSSSERITGLKNSSNTAEDIKRTKRSFIVMTALEYDYLKSNLITLYGFAAAGINYTNTTEQYKGTNQKDSKTGFAYQITPIAIRVGKKLGGIAELGFGHKGIFNAGVSYRF